MGRFFASGSDVSRPSGISDRPLGAIDGFSIFLGIVAIRGWCFSMTARITALEVLPRAGSAGEPRSFLPPWLPSPDVAAAIDPAAENCRFEVALDFGQTAHEVCGGMLVASLADGTRWRIGMLGAPRDSAASHLVARFFGMLTEIGQPRVLEVGSRARSGVTRRAMLPVGTTYLGCDIMPGENVDIVCDAHDLVAAMAGRQFDAVMAFSVLEHILMPWKFVVELNQVMAEGAIGLFTTHQCWPMHDIPWDYWRFSSDAWKALLNPATGFEILAAAMGEPAHVVAADTHEVTNFSRDPAGFLASNVLFRKISTTRLHWDVDPASIVRDSYPA